MKDSSTVALIFHHVVLCYVAASIGLQPQIVAHNLCSAGPASNAEGTSFALKDLNVRT